MYSKLVLGAVVFLFFAGAVFGGVVVWENPEHLGEYLTYIGAPTATAIGFYAWKAKAENVLKIGKTVETDKKISKETKKQIINGIAKTLKDIETEE